MAWEQNTRKRPGRYNVMVQVDGSAPVPVNRSGSSAAMGDFVGSQLVYQQYKGNPYTRGRSDLLLFDIPSGTRSKVLGVNSRQWEYWPSHSEGWLLYGWWKPKKEVRRLFLHDLETGERRLLDKTKGGTRFIGPGQVQGNYAVWSTCRPRCNVFRYDIAANTKQKIDNPGFFQRAPSVTPGGTVYFSRGGKGCGASVALVRSRLDGQQEVLVELQQGLDIRDTYAYVEPNGTVEVHYERNACRTKAGSDIYKVQDLALATLTVVSEVIGSASGTVTSAPSGIICGSNCSADFEKGTSVTLTAVTGPNTVFAGWTGPCTGTGNCVVTMDEAKSVTATFLPLGSITISKDAIPNDPDVFTFDPSANLFGPNFQLDDDPASTTPNEVTFPGLGSGTYTVLELGPAFGWDLTDIDCLATGAMTTRSGNTITIVLSSGGAASCTFVNDLQEGRILVDKATNPAGSTETFGFNPSWGENFTLTDGQPLHDSGLILDPRLPHSVAEAVSPPGWVLTDASCTDDGGPPSNITLSEGETVTCTFTNTQNGRIVVSEQTNPNGSSQIFTFTRSYGGDFSLADGETHNSGFTLTPGTYSVSENPVAGWDLTSATCSDGSAPAAISLSPGETVTCTFNNTEQGSITIMLDVVPDDPQDFSFSTVGGLSPPAFTLDDDDDLPLPSGTSDIRVYSGVLPGTYRVTETIPSLLWNLDSVACVDPDSGSSGDTVTATATIDFDPGEAVTCTFTNSLL
jgi:hypothetical protein